MSKLILKRRQLNGKPLAINLPSAAPATATAPAGGFDLTFPGAAGTLPTGQSALTSASGAAPTVDGAGNLLLYTTKGDTFFKAIGQIAFAFDMTVKVKPGSPIEFPMFIGGTEDGGTFYQVYVSAKNGTVYFGSVVNGTYNSLSNFSYVFSSSDTSVGVRVQSDRITLLRNGAVIGSTTQTINGPSPFGYVGLGVPAQNSALSEIVITPVPATGLLATASAIAPSGAAIPFTVTPVGGAWGGQTIVAPTLAGLSWDHASQASAAGTATALVFNGTFSAAFNGTVPAFTDSAGGLTPSNTLPITVIKAKPPGTLTSSAGYTMSQTAASGVWGAGTSYLTVAPPSGGWPSGFALTVATAVTEGSIGNIGGATQFGQVLTPASASSSITFAAVAAQPGNMAIVLTNNSGLADPDALQFGVTNPAAAPPPLTDMIVHMPFNFDVNDSYQPVGWVDPVGGIGPYGFTVSGGLWQGAGNLGFTQYDPANHSASVTLTLTDARGVSVSKTVTPTTGSGLMFNDRNPVTNNTTVAVLGQMYWITQSDNWAVTGPNGEDLSGALYPVYGRIYPRSLPPPIKSYPVKLAKDSRTLLTTLTVVPYTTPTYIEFVQKTVSTSMLANSYVGTARATTSNNSPSFSMVDPSGLFQMATSGVMTVLAQPTSTGQFPVSITVTDGLSSFTQSVTINVQQGNTLAPSNMDFSSLTKAFQNDTLNNAIGTPAVSGVTGSKSWSLVSQTGVNPYAVSIGQPAPFSIDASAGAIVCPILLGAGNAYLDGSGNLVLPSYTYTLLVSCTDGINTCTAPVDIVVNWAPVSKTIHVGRGQSSAGYTGATVGYETLTEARKDGINGHGGTYKVIVHADTDPDYYTNDNGLRTSDYGARFPWQGPVIIQGVASSNGAVLKPRLGGPAANNVPGGSDMRGKGFMVFGDGDGVALDLEVSCCHDADGTHGVEGIRKDGQTAGNLSLLRVHIHDCDNGLESGFGHARILGDGCLIENCGTSHVSNGACHNIYVGAQFSFTFRNSTSRHSNLGHLVKSRAMNNDIYNNTLYDGIGGSASACINLPNGGAGNVYGNLIEKGQMAYGPGAVRWLDEGASYVTNTLNVHDNTISVLTLSGNHFGAPGAVDCTFATPNVFGLASTVTVHNNSVWLAPGCRRTIASNYNGATINDDGTWTTLALPPALPTTRPDRAGAPIPPYAFLFHQQDQDDFTYFSGVMQIATSTATQIRVPSSTSSGTTLASVAASNELAAQGGSSGTPNPFSGGTTWAIAFDAQWNGDGSAWAPSGRYGVSANGDGTARLTLAGSLPAANSVDNVQLKATAPNGTVSLMRYPVMVTA